MDHQAPIQYIRQKKAIGYVPDTVDFEYEYKHTATIVKQTTTNNVVTTSTETVQETKRKKVELQLYEHNASHGENVEHFFAAFHVLQRELRTKWTNISKAQSNDASLLFSAMDRMLDGQAQIMWRAVVKEQDGLAGAVTRDWKTFKTDVGLYISTRLLPEESYKKQKMYILTRRKPKLLSPIEWKDRLDAMQLYLPFMIGSLKEYNEADLKDGWKGWWEHGGLTHMEYMQVLENNCPPSWSNTRAEVHYTDFSAQQLVQWYQLLHDKEAKPNGIGDAHARDKGKVARAPRDDSRLFHGRANQRPVMPRSRPESHRDVRPRGDTRIHSSRSHDTPRDQRRSARHSTSYRRDDRQEKRQDAYLHSEEADYESLSSEERSLTEVNAELYTMDFSDDESDRSSDRTSSSDDSRPRRTPRRKPRSQHHPRHGGRRGRKHG